MEMNMGKFSEKLVELLELAKKKKNVLEYQEISDYFKDQPLDAEQMDKIFDFLEASGVDVLRITENSADDLMLDDDMDIDGLDDEEEGEWILAADILQRIQKASKMKFSSGQVNYFGRILQRLGVKSYRKTRGVYYLSLIHISEPTRRS